MAKTPRAARKAPVKYSVELGKKIAERIAGGESWLQMSKEDKTPAYPTLWLWKEKHPEFAEAMARARAISADWKADKALEVAEQRGTPTLHVNTLMKQAAQIAPARWGSKAGSEGAAGPRTLVIRVRHFERVEAPDGSAFVRELLPAPKEPGQ
jgi:hypothetical protein